MTNLRNFSIFFLFFVCQNLIAQTTMSGDIVNHLGQIIDDMPGDTGDDYAAPTNPQLANWETCLVNLLQKKYAECEVIANQLNYDLIRFTDNGNNQVYYILQSQPLGSNYWGTYVFNPTACQSNLIIQAPHPRNDSNTGDQGIFILKEIGALFFMVAGTHRCNSDIFSACSGTTSTCDNGAEKFRESDMAHTDESIFHKTTAILLDTLIQPFFIQLHGFSKGTDDPSLILSNSTTIAPPIDYLSKLGNALVAIDPTLTFEVAHLNPSIKLKGTTNTQGRLINGSSNACFIASPTNTGRFLHIEQERPKLRADAIGWQKMADALKVTFRNLNLGTNSLILNDYSALDTLSAASVIESGMTSIFKAGKLVQILSGFHSKFGSIFVAKIDGCLPLSPLNRRIPLMVQTRPNVSSLKVAPNPFIRSVIIDLAVGESQSISLKLYSATGMLLNNIVVNKHLDKGNYKYNLVGQDFVETGVYFLEMETSTTTITQKLIRID